MIYRGDNYHHCLECKCAINFGDTVTQGKWGYYCGQCSERENMPNIKITAEVDGKQVPLKTVSTETFEAIKALEKPKEIPVARLGNFKGWPSEGRLILKVTPNIRSYIDKHVLAIDIATGDVAGWWKEKSDEDRINGYKNIITL